MTRNTLTILIIVALFATLAIGCDKTAPSPKSTTSPVATSDESPDNTPAVRQGVLNGETDKAASDSDADKDGSDEDSNAGDLDEEAEDDDDAETDEEEEEDTDDTDTDTDDDEN